MRNLQWRLLSFAFAGALSASGCVREDDIVKGDFSSCTVGQTCEVEGRLDLMEGEPAWAAVVTNGNACAKIALPDSFYEQASKWRGKRVVVIGRVFEQPGDAEGGVLMWFSEKGRKLSMGACDQGIGIFAESMRTSGGKVWPP